MPVLLILRCPTDEDRLAAAITAGALGIIVLLVGGNVFPVETSSNLNCIDKGKMFKSTNEIDEILIFVGYIP